MCRIHRKWKQVRRRAAFVAGLLAAAMAGDARAETVKEVRLKMGSRFEMTAVHPDADLARGAIERAFGEIDRVEDLISSWRSTSATSEVNRHAGQRPVAVPQELFDLVRRALKLSVLTEGAFDITFAGLGELWDFKAENPILPKTEEVKRALVHVGYRKMVLDPERRTIFLDDPHARIGFGALGKGYAANRAVFVLKENGIESGVVNAGGDLVAFGRRENGAPWEIGIAHPDYPDHVLARLPISEQAVVTSGDYESFLVIDGRRFGHILDPRTGFPAEHVRSVTVVCPDAELADGLATGLSVLGPEKGLALINALRGIEALMIDTEGRLHFSDQLKSHLSDKPPTRRPLTRELLNMEMGE